jgi:hypothetical protein
VKIPQRVEMTVVGLALFLSLSVAVAATKSTTAYGLRAKSYKYLEYSQVLLLFQIKGFHWVPSKVP